ncbi:MAG: thioredoxin family protein [Cyanobium sp. RS427]|nr:thioredoxin family protein [Cyanobium sp. RS427]|tara:strand:+ start:318 stop:620 length:303 start_codon:yes stop_codon:yes gene_type:complete
MHVIKFSSEDCGTCHRMSHYDAKVAGELGAEFVSVMLQDTEAYRKYRKILLKQYPNKEGMGWPTYLLVTDPEGDFIIHGELKGGMPKGEFRTRLGELLAA